MLDYARYRASSNPACLVAAEMNLEFSRLRPLGGRVVLGRFAAKQLAKDI